MNETHSLGYSARERIRSPGLFPLILVALFAVLRAVDATPTEESITRWAKKILSRAEDIRQLGRSLQGPDREIAFELVGIGTDTHKALFHIQDLLIIKSQVQNDADKRMIEPIIDSRAKEFTKYIDIDVEMINAGIADAHNRGLIDTASKLKDDLRELKELLLR
jgi:hypothetical protein